LDGGYSLGADGGAGGGGLGGAVCNEGLLMLTNCVFDQNAVTGGAGGAGDECGPCITPTMGNPGPPGNALGGAFANFGTAILVSNIFLNNSAAGPGTNVGTLYSVSPLEIDTNTLTLGDYFIATNQSAPFLVLQPASQIVLGATTLTLTALAVGYPQPTYQWRWNGTNITMATDATLVLTNV
jgi:hypothetical protein